MKQNMKVYPANSANKLQWSIVDGLRKNSVKDLYIVNSLPVGTWPKFYRRVFLSGTHSGNLMEKYSEIESINVPIAKQISRYIGAIRKLREIPDRNVLIYSTYLPYLMAATNKRLKKTTTLIVTDLPQYYDLAKVSKFRAILRKAVSRLSYHYIAKIGKFVLLTKQMHEVLQVGNRPYIVMEGIVPSDAAHEVVAIQATNGEPGGKEILLYTGSLSTTNGVRDLIDAFQHLKHEDAELWICGSGEDEQHVKQSAEQDRRIKYFGFVSAEEAINLQQQATILVNPRRDNDKYTEYSFPSKTMEYMLSGKPVVMYKLPGIPDEYDEHLFYVMPNESLVVCLNRVASNSREMRVESGNLSRLFVLKEKNAKVQVERLLSLMYSEQIPRQ